MGLKEDIEMQWRSGGALVRLIMLNVAVFVLLGLVNLILFLTQTDGIQVSKWLASHSYLPSLIKKPWSPITYMFTHAGFLHLLFNMIILYFGGRLFRDLLGDARLIGNYVLGGFAGLVLYIVAYNTFPVFDPVVEGSWIIGASAAVMGVFFGIAAYRPDMVVHLMFLGAVKLKWIAIFYAVTDLLSIDGGNPGGHIAHLGGALYGIISATQLKKGNDYSKGFGEWVMNIGKRKRRSKLRVEKRPKGKAAKSTTSTGDDEKQAKIDLILDKIGKSGYESLSKSEKDFLFKASNDR